MLELPRLNTVVTGTDGVETAADTIVVEKTGNSPKLTEALPDRDAVLLARQSEQKTHQSTGVAGGTWLALQGASTDRARLMAIATREPYEPQALLDELCRDPVLAELFAGPNTTGESLAEHSLAVARRAEHNLSAQPATRRVLMPFLGLFRLKMLLHDIGKPVTLQRDGNSTDQLADTVRVLRDRLTLIGFSRADIEHLGNQIRGSVRDGTVGLRDLGAGERARRREFGIDARDGVPLYTVILMRLSLFLADASYYQVVRDKVFVEGADGVFRLRPDVPEAKLAGQLGRAFPEFPVEEYFAAEAPACFPKAPLVSGRKRLDDAIALARAHLTPVTYEDGTSYLSEQIEIAQLAAETLGGEHGIDVAATVLVRSLLKACDPLEGPATAWDGLPDAPEVVSTAIALTHGGFADDARVIAHSDSPSLAHVLEEVLTTRTAVAVHGRLAADTAVVIHLAKLGHVHRMLAVPGEDSHRRANLADAIARAEIIRDEVAAVASPELLAVFDETVRRADLALVDLGGCDVALRRSFLRGALA